MLRFSATTSARCWAVVPIVVASICCAAATCSAQHQNRLISQQLARQHGLERAWFSRAEVNSARNHVVRWVLDNDQLLILTSAGVVQAMDANTGRTEWVTAIGNPDYPSLGPAANDELVALVNGSTLYVLDRQTGRPITDWRLGGAPGAAPAVTQSHVFVPLATGRMEAYPLAEDDSSTWFYQSYGRTLVAPLATPGSVVWSTDAGHLYLATADNPRVRYRLETPSEFLAPPAYREHMIYAISLFGELYAVDEQTGSRRWKYATGYPTDRAPAVVGELVFVTSDQPALHCVEAKSGHGVWESDNVAQFAAASDQRVYGVDRYGTLVVLDRATGAPIGRLPTGGKYQALVNDQTDRLYLLSDDGIVQCLHEVGRREPIYHDSRAAAVKPPEAPGATDSSAVLSTEDQPVPPEDRPAPAEADETETEVVEPFDGVESEQPAEEGDDAPADESPFGVDDDPFAF